MRSIRLTFIVCFCLSFFDGIAQWEGASGSTGLIHRDGSMILGGSSVMGSYGSNWKYIELHDEGILSIGPSANNRLQMYFTSSFGSTLSASNALKISGKDGIRFQTNGDWQNDKMTIFSDGNVGIGTSNTYGYKLAVNGTIGSKEVKVETSSPWPDYVFSDTYKLNSLSEVSSYIKENKHLPGIPSADEVEENGIKLGEMNAKLLEKIEELTLYLIQEKARNDELEKRVEQLEKQVLKE